MIGVVIIVYGVYPDRLFSSLSNDFDKIKFYLFFHGHDAALDRRLQEFAASHRATYLPYGVNRGLAKSWNDGIRFSVQEGNRHTLLVNDDIHWYDGAFEQFISFLDTQGEYGFATLMGTEGPESPLSGERRTQDFACCALGPLALQRVGCFDQAFVPAYYEDVDYVRRHHIAGLEAVVDTRVHVEHNRSQTTRRNPEIQAGINDIMRRNGEYYARKWGGPMGQEKFERPFNRSDCAVFIPFESADAPYPADVMRPNTSQVSQLGRESLDSIGLATNTDKSSNHHNFLPFYEYFLHPRRDERLRILEIGVAHGGSSAMWERYFPNATLVAVDINPEVRRYATARVTIELANQSDPKHLADLCAKHGPFDLVIDDGSHFWDHQILSFQVLFPSVRAHGFYIMEDIDTSYGSYVESYRSRAGVTAADYLHRLVDELVGDAALDPAAQPDLYIRSFRRLIESVSFHRRTCLIRRNGAV